MNELNTAQLARLRRFVQLDLITSWVVIPATEHESVRVQIITSGEDVATINRVHLDAYLTGLAHGSWLASGQSRWRRSVLASRERGAISDGAGIVLGLLVAATLSVLWWGWLPLLLVGGVMLVSCTVCLLLGRMLAAADARARLRR